MAQFDKSKVLITQFESVVTVTVCWLKGLLDENKLRHAEKVGVPMDTSAENTDIVINNIKVFKADSVKMFLKCVLILACFEEQVCSQQASINANVERKKTITNVVSKIGQLHESGRSINRSDYSLEILKLSGGVEANRFGRMKELRADVDAWTMRGS